MSEGTRVETYLPKRTGIKTVSYGQEVLYKKLIYVARMKFGGET
jgi:hypothetical protein